MFLNFFVFALAIFVCRVFAQFDQCDLVYTISTVGRSAIVNYPGAVRPGTSCRYQIIAPVDSTIEASCTFNVPSVINKLSNKTLFHIKLY